MGIGIIGISKAKRVACTGEYVEGEYDVCLEEHNTVQSFSSGRDRLKPGCYIVGRGGRAFDFDINYAGYDAWIRNLARLALAVEPEEVWTHPRRYRGKPFVELIAMPDMSDGNAIGPLTSAKLYGDFAAFAARARRYYAMPASRRLAQSRQLTQPKGEGHLVKRHGMASAMDFSEAIGGTFCTADEDGDIGWMWEVYRDFRKVFQLARNAGLVLFC